MVNHYTASDDGGENVAKFGEADWQTNVAASGAEDEEAPNVAPYYFGIKEIQNDDHEEGPDGVLDGWKKSMLKRVHEAIGAWPAWLDQRNLFYFQRSPEFWFSHTPGAGAKVHMDSHPQPTASLQISGRRVWRLGMMARRCVPFISYMYGDGVPYSWNGFKPIFQATVNPGDMLFFPPGMLHETKNICDVCAASVTFQFDFPQAAGMLREFWPRTRRTPDLRETWTYVRFWASLGQACEKGNTGMAYEKALVWADKYFEHYFLQDYPSGIDSGIPRNEFTKSMQKLMHKRGFDCPPTHDYESLLHSTFDYHDRNADGRVEKDEFVYGFTRWSNETRSAIIETPKVWRAIQINDMEAEPLRHDLDALAMQWSLREESRIRNLQPDFFGSASSMFRTEL